MHSQKHHHAHHCPCIHKDSCTIKYGTFIYSTVSECKPQSFYKQHLKQLILPTSSTVAKHVPTPQTETPRFFGGLWGQRLVRWEKNTFKMDILFFLLHVLVHPYCVQLCAEKENRHHSFKELINFSHRGDKTPWAISNHSWSLWKTYYCYYKQQVGEESSHTQNAEQGRRSCKANLGWRTETLQLSGGRRHKCSIWSLAHAAFWWWIL